MDELQQPGLLHAIYLSTDHLQRWILTDIRCRECLRSWRTHVWVTYFLCPLHGPEFENFELLKADQAMVKIWSPLHRGPLQLTEV